MKLHINTWSNWLFTLRIIGIWCVCFQCSERRTFTFLNGFTSLKTNKKILGNRHCPYLKCLWNAKSGVSTQFQRRGMRPAGGQRATDTFTLLSSILCLINFYRTVLIRFSWINSIHSDDKGCVRLAVTTWLTDFLSNTLILMAGDTSVWRSSCNWQFHITLLHVVLHWFVLIWFSWFHSIIAGNFDGEEMGSTDTLLILLLCVPS